MPTVSIGFFALAECRYNAGIRREADWRIFAGSLRKVYMMNQPEVVIGAGEIGCGTAYWLSKSGYTSRARKIRGRIADQANQLIKHFYSLGGCG
jgi:hypothetical protein